MDCGVERISGGASGAGMLNVPPGTDGAQPQSLTPAAYVPTDSEQAQFEADKRAVYKHPLFPLLALLFERCELATQSSDIQSSDAFNLDIQAFVQHQERDRKPFLANEPEIDGLMIKAIQVLRIHLLELEKVQELCKDFCNRYITCLKGKMQSENLLRSDYTQGPGVMSALENNNNMLSHGNSESGSDSNSPVQYTISPTQQSAVQPGADCLESRGVLTQDAAPDTAATAHVYPHHHHLQTGGQPPQSGQVTPTGGYSSNSSSSVGGPNSNNSSTTATTTPAVGIQGTPTMGVATSNGQLSPAPTTPGGSADDCDSDCRVGSKKQKRGVLPKHATTVMRSWLFQHLVHPYPTEDEKRQIAAQTNLTLLQVNNWFINARRRILQPMLDSGATTGLDGTSLAGVVGHKSQSSQKKKSQNNGQGNRRYWPGDIASLQPQLNSGVLSSSDDDCDSYSSDDNEGGLVIDSNTGTNGSGGGGGDNQSSTTGNHAQPNSGANGHHADTPTSYSPESDQP